MPLNVTKSPPIAEHPKIHNFLDLSGETKGRLLVIHFVGSEITGKPSWFCKCECGVLIVANANQLHSGKTQSCGCLMVDRTREANTRHGKKGTKVYRVWSGMLNRCRNKNSKDYERYGGRGIVVCKRWVSFENFYTDMGDPPEGDFSIERRNNDRGYMKSNCCWVLRSQQAVNRRGNVRVTVDGVTLTASQWDRSMGFYPGTVARRILRGWNAHKAVTSPIATCFSRPQQRKNK